MHDEPARRTTAHHESAEAFAELVGVIDRLDDLGEQLMAASRPSQQWHDATRRRLMAVAAEEGIGVTARHRASAAVPEPKRAPVTDDMFPKRPRGGRRLAIVAALLTGTVAVSGVSAASGDALPGDTLYNVKRSTERAQLALAGNDLGKAQLYLEFARTRIQEAAEITGDEAAVASALSDAAGELRSGTAILGELAVANEDASPLDYVDLFTNEHRWVLEDLVDGLDGEALTAGEELIAVLEAAAVRSVELREALDCTVPGGQSDELGPIPGSCTKDNRDATSPAQSGTPEEAESGPTGNGVEPSDEDEGDSGGTEPTGESPSGAVTDAPLSDPTTGGTSAPATTGDPSPMSEDDDVLGELSGIISDLIN
ncbi:DUF5667 domain-containing protein [Glycomyces sp. TRM65418]|uniref:DUF5667 domain-containing protein n=1 Tax=Glycomyces sp. TRM65418 TaxID=2867006 RepID=UPI001CE59028|nr:DUF5667 domain-containing protein [Glycomyces sp. TRM65418]MCC3763527.1 DUF5667 domain-containing protein [Glycomyces sp. TRM65418]QZD57510.1 hypothetical protein K3N28_10555 [Glycomyces sp. TRM65418]